MGATALVGSFLVAGGSQLYGGVTQANAAREQGAYQRQQYEFNSRIAKLQSADALARGEETARNVGRAGEKIQSAQRAAFAGQGVDVDSGSAAATQIETAGLTAHDVQTVKNNAWLEAWGYRVQAADLSNKGQFAQRAAENSANNTLLTGGLMAASYGLRAGAAYDNWGGKMKVPDYGGGGGPGGMATVPLY